jgi:hypothetical protein
MCREVVNLTPRTPYFRGEKSPGPTEHEAVWASESIWTLWRREKFLAGIRTSDLLARSLVTTLTTLSWLPYINTRRFFSLISLNTKSIQKYNILNNVTNRESNKMSVEHDLYSQKATRFGCNYFFRFGHNITRCNLMLL